jgi:Cof subfamily protein (haloacid dehalogenase superfamily)
MLGVVPRIDLIALDLDGTLLDSSEAISPANRSAIMKACRLGVRVVLVTGRGSESPLAFARDLGLRDPVICAHGALTKDIVTGHDLRHIAIPREHSAHLIAYAQEHALEAAIYIDEHFYRAAGTRSYMADQKGPRWVDVPSLAPLLGRDATFIRFFGAPSVEAIRAKFSQLPVHFKFETWGVFEELAITSEEATKERALAELCRDLGVDADAVLAVGDSRNDLPMLHWAGVGVAMGNALPEVIEAAPHVTSSNDEDGVASAIEHFVLAPERREPRSA